ncbi:hypothetical protein [Allorhodopirellula solitaria]|uniref:Uncharacterized protein n=1 Tax=Allorhodopirellula solitaria TaxID=2527987 RepID=A0A5C5X0H1_9BACT|nr:hypothetical protein [Allorhodopirellula solitaria]TWT55702.1 hypothetical protein CA85_48020 [Allorhodopirellula solitaria]
MNSFPKLYADIPTIGELSAEDAACVVRELDLASAGETRTGQPKIGAGATRSWFGTRPYEYSNQTIGFLEFVNATTENHVSIQSLGNVSPDSSLKGAAIDIRLDRLRIYDYPGRGKHQIVVQFKANHELSGTDSPEPVVFNQAFDVNEDDAAGVIGYPIFNGLVVGKRGVSFQLCTVNARNETDEQLLNALKSESVKAGLNLLATSQPVLKPFVDVGRGLVESLLKRNRNVKVQELFLGLDFDDAPLAAPMRCGNYIVVQVKESQNFDWNGWVFDKHRWAFVAKDNPTEILPYNYFVFRVALSPGS